MSINHAPAPLPPQPAAQEALVVNVTRLLCALGCVGRGFGMQVGGGDGGGGGV